MNKFSIYDPEYIRKYKDPQSAFDASFEWRYGFENPCPKCAKDTSIVLHICTMGEALYGCVGLDASRFCALDDFINNYLSMFPWVGKEHQSLGWRFSCDLTEAQEKRLTQVLHAITSVSDEECDRRVEEAMRSNAPLPGGVLQVPLSCPPSHERTAHIPGRRECCIKETRELSCLR